MSADTLMLLRTPLPAAQVRTALVHDPALADLGLADRGEWVGMGNKRLSLTVNPWDGDELDLIPDGFETADVTVTFTPGWNVEGWEAMQRVLTAVLRIVPGDVCLASENAAGPDLRAWAGWCTSTPMASGPRTSPTSATIPSASWSASRPGLPRPRRSRGEGKLCPRPVLRAT